MFGFRERRGKFLTSWVTIGFAWTLAHGVILGIYCTHGYSSRHVTALHIQRTSSEVTATAVQLYSFKLTV
jgi:hypothetical protein